MRKLFLVLCVSLLTVSAIHAQTNLVANGDFSAPLGPEWIVGNWGTGYSSYGISNGVFHLTVTAIGAAAWNVFFYHFEDIKLTGGANYIYSFTSHATAACSVSTQVKTVGQPPNAAVWFSDSAVIIGATDSTYSFPFSPTADDDSGQVNFSLGFGNVPLNQTIYIKNVSITEVSSGIVSGKQAKKSFEFVRMNGNQVTVTLANPANAEMKLFSLRGVQIADYSAVLRSMNAGSHQINLGSLPVCNGIYLLKVNNGVQTVSKTVTLTK
ncbi:MAG TPA: carbohydrate binding domain-containing protein [Chitinivibrionales bacterium]|nr:carbohydrate binding domain-containing protein [Chitinivibrionales bacterium]